MTTSDNQRSAQLIEYYHVVKRNKWTIVLFLILALALGYWYNSKLVPIFQATATLIIDKESSYSPITGRRAEFESYISESMSFNTHFRMITSRPVLEKVVKRLELDQDPKGPQKEEIAEPNPIRQWFQRIKKNLALLLGKDETRPSVVQKIPSTDDRLMNMVQTTKGMVTIEPIEDTRLLTINAVSPSPGKAQAVANGVAEAYIDFNISNRLKASQNTLEWLSEHLYEMKQKLEAAEQEFLKFKHRASLVSLEESQKTIAQKMTDFNDAYIQARNKRLELEAKLEQARQIARSGQNIPRLQSMVSNDLISTLYARLMDARGERSRLSKVYKSQHPKIIEVETLIQDTEKKLQKEVEKEIENLKAERDLLANKEKIVQNTISEMENEAMSLNEKGLEYTILKRNMEMNQQLYDTILSRLKEADISRNVDVSNIRIVEKALLPEYPVGPDKKRNLLIAVVVGLMAGIGFAFFREYTDRTLHSDEDVQKYLGLPVLAVIPMAKKAKGTPYAAHTTASHSKTSNPEG